ncbi:PX domain-containing protein EREL2-like isoform X1 [Apium graveolens]|uniref:PX domain-containing protein EREL2-like isoform X1 n=2 Tax=Apium graveolens TaxID=4045 RepID=UPI003D7B93E6
MHRRSPPKHRHDGTSPLPMGMDWSPPPRNWSGRDTVWPHDPSSGWSFCVTIPSWAVLPKSRESDPIVFYRVQVGIQSPQGVTTMRGVLRRFNDFMKLLAALKKAFPRKILPPAPPKGLLRIKTKALLEERRSSLEVWMEKLLSDIDISRSVVVASFLELEAAARSSFQDEKQNGGNSNSSVDDPMLSLQPESSSIQSVVSASFTSDYGSDTAYEASEVGTSSMGKDYSSEVGIEELSLDEDLTDPIERLMKYGMSNIDDGLFMGQAILDQLEGLPRNKGNAVKAKVVTTNMSNGNASKSAYFGANALEHMAQPDHNKASHHARNFSSESIGSDVSSLKGSVLSGPNTLDDGSLDVPRGSGVSHNMEADSELQFPSDVKLMLPLDHRQIMNRALVTMQRRLVTARTDLEDLISRLNQEVAVKDYLTRKVKDLEVELETTKQRSKENLQQAVLVEKERLTQMQWEMEELRRNSFEMELKLKSQQDEKADSESVKDYTTQGKDMMRELDATKQQLVELQKQHRELETNSKADIKVLVKEIKSLRSSQAEYRRQLSESFKEKSEAEKLLQQEKQNSEHANTAIRKLLHQYECLHSRLQECNINFVNEDKLVINPSSPAAAFDFQASDNRASLLLSEVQLLAKDDDGVSTTDNKNFSDDGANTVNQALRDLLTNIFVDNTNLRKQVNTVMRYALKINMSSDTNDEQPSEPIVQNKSIEK